MKQIRLLLLAFFILLAALLALSISAGDGVLARSLAQNGAPQVVSYQGRVTVDGIPYNGSGFFKFAVVNAAGDTTYWSNDGSASGGGEPTNAVTLSVSSGLFNVLLGDTGLSNMTALPASTFEGTERYLRVWFSDDGSVFTLLSPDQRIAAVPYALQAEEAKSAATAGDADTLDGYHASDLIDNPGWSLTGNSGTLPTTNFLGTTDAQPLVLRTDNSERARLDAQGNLGLGTTSPTERLTVRGNARVLGEDIPKALGFTSANLDYPMSVYVSGTYAYVASYINHSLAIFDISDPNNIGALGYTSTKLRTPSSVYVSGTYAYVASENNDRLVIFDVSNPNNIVAMGFTNTNLDGPLSVYVSGRYAYVASQFNSRLVIFDVSDPNNILPLGYTSTNLSFPKSVYVSGRYAYVVSANTSLLAVFDVSDPNNILPLGYTSTNLYVPWSVYVSGHYAYVASGGNDRLVVFDVSDPNNIVALDYTSTNLDNPISIHASGRYAYVVSQNNNRLAIYDVSDPNNIVPIGFTNTNLEGPFSVNVSGRYAYITSSFNDRLAVFELNHLEAPTLETGSLQSVTLDVTDNAIIGNNLHVQGGLNVGPGSALIGGDLSVQGNLFAHSSVTTLTGDTTLAVTQSGVVLVNNAAASTITLPAAASSSGLTFTIKCLTVNAVTVASAGGTIDGAATQSLAAQYDYLTVISDGSNWYIIAR